MTWRSIFGDEIIVQKKLEEIYNILKDAANNHKISLMGGNLGIAVFFFYYGRYLKKKSIYNRGWRTLEDIFKTVNNGYNYSKFSDGLGGFVWTILHLVQEGFLHKELALELNMLVPYLTKEMFKDINDGYYDYLHGALGIALSLSKFEQSEDCSPNLYKLIDILEDKGIKDGSSIKWKSKFRGNEEIYVFNIGLSHGMSSIVGVLLHFMKNKILKERSVNIIEKAVKYIIGIASSNVTSHSVFPSVVTNDKPKYNSRLAWCYGDLGIAITLYRAGCLLNRLDIQNFALVVFFKTIKRKKLDDNNVVDAGLCHGTSGIAHIYNRMYNYTRKNDFKEAALYWFEETFKMAKYDDGLAGYKAWRRPENGGSENSYGFLEGIAGIGLALISSISDIEPKWDECLLLS